ncbi:sulfite exporter TauE/SafE family protein [Ponticaulis sp.]|uniref:sulfite exporter TauE/SafE family protein n=1 Tax=Ponticaulis sp. TaxID=2020902 RepID=UPI0025EF2E4E|nr:sulfite exporter TauE/SafE family protein [Ponticaulis sp.]
MGDYSWLQLVQMVFILMGAGLAAGLVAGLFGIGGGFVVVPTLIVVFEFFDFSDSILMKMAVATSLATIVVTGFRSAQAHYKKGAVDMQIIRDWAPWLTIGAILGTILTRVLDGSALKLIFSVGVFLMGLHFVFPAKGNVRFHFSAEMPKGFVLAPIATFLGGFSALLGIGGGTPAVMVMTACQRPIHQAVATAAGFGVIIAVPGTISNMIVGFGEAGLPPGSIGYVNLIAALSIVSMSIFTAPIGAKLAHSLDGVKLKRYFGIYLIATSAYVFYKAVAG